MEERQIKIYSKADLFGQKCKKHYKDKAFVCCRRKSIFIFAVPFSPPPPPLTPHAPPLPQNK